MYFGFIKKEKPKARSPLKKEMMSSFLQWAIKNWNTPGEELENGGCGFIRTTLGTKVAKERDFFLIRLK